MLVAFHVFTLVLVSVAMALSLAHALELPGKLRLDRDTYLAVHQIYYPGFTYGGFSEVAGILALASLLVLIPFADARFWWLAASLALLLASHLTYWFFTHPGNGFWLKDLELTGVGKGVLPRLLRLGTSRLGEAEERLGVFACGPSLFRDAEPCRDSRRAFALRRRPRQSRRRLVPGKERLPHSRRRRLHARGNEQRGRKLHLATGRPPVDELLGRAAGHLRAEILLDVKAVRAPTGDGDVPTAKKQMMAVTESIS